MPKRNAAVFQYRGHRLVWRNDTATWSIHWTQREGDDGSGLNRTKRKTLGTADRDQAEQVLVELANARSVLDHEPAEQITIAMLVTRHYQNHLAGLPSGDAARSRRDHIVDAIGHLALAELRIETQERFVAVLRAKGLGNSTIARVLTDLRSAIMRAWKRQEIDRPVHVITVQPDPGRDRVLEVEELGRLWAAAATEPHYASMFLLLALGTGSRPGALLDLTREQVNLERGYIDLHPPGTLRTSKRRAIVPLAPVLRPWIATIPAGHLVQLDGRPLGSIKSAWRRIRTRAGLGPDVVPHVLRHTVATHLHRAGVAVDEIAMFLGHSTGRRTTERYLHHRPEHLAAARDAVQALISETARLAGRAVSVSLAG
jgi:integrase